MATGATAPIPFREFTETRPLSENLDQVDDFFDTIERVQTWSALGYL